MMTVIAMETILSEAPMPDVPMPDGELLKRMHRQMVLIRSWDQRALKLQRSGRIGFCILSQGEEAAQIGSAAALEDSDWIVPTYRQYGVGMWRGVPLKALADQLFGNVDDVTKGRQMPYHFSYAEKNFVSVSSVIGTQISHAAGIGLAAKIRGDSTVAVGYMGDGATSSNDFHAGLNFAGVTKAPVVFVCVNNQYAISLPLQKQTAAPSIAEKAKAYGFPGVRVDGNDVVTVYQAMRWAVDHARRGDGPVLLELLTYRLSPHSSSDDPGRYRSKEEEERWKGQDPILRLERALMESGLMTSSDINQVWTETAEMVLQVTKDAEALPKPPLASLFEDVYETMPLSLAADQQRFLEQESQLDLPHVGEFPL
jgi:pyruvate dehydrogenase E1 component alpha subunit